MVKPLRIKLVSLVLVSLAAGARVEDGCWEPAALQFPDGEIQLYFANEAPYAHSHEQEISMRSSLDAELTWSRPRTVAFRKGARDGMPVPCLLKDGKTVALAILGTTSSPRSLSDQERGRHLTNKNEGKEA